MAVVKFKNYLNSHILEIAMTALCALVSIGINLYQPLLVREAVDGLTDGSMGKQAFINIVLLYGGLTVLVIWFSRELRRFPQRLSHKVEYSIRRDLFAHLTTLDPSFFREQRTGDLMTRMSDDITVVRDSIGQGLLQGFRTGGILIFAPIVMLMTAPTLAILLFAIYPPMVWLMTRIVVKMKIRQKALQENVSEVSNFCQESFAGIRCIKGFHLEKHRSEEFEKVNDGQVQKYMSMHILRQAMWPLMALWFGIGTISVINIAARQIIAEKLTIGTLLQFIQYMLYLQYPLLALSWMISLLQRGKVSWQRIQEVFSREPEIKNCDGVSDFDETLAVKDNIEFKGVGLKIKGQTLLEDINLKIPAGTVLGVTGPTGSGKTLLVSLLARLIDPTDGEILINSKPIKNMTLEELRSKIGFAAQEPILFSRELKENIAFGLDEQNIKTVEWAADIANLSDEVNRFPAGYETMLGERGITLSGGQRQRTSIARAIAREPEILILDDVLASVDTRTESEIMKKLQPIMKERTTLFVSHRISTLRYADEIIVIENGKITQSGSRKQLLSEDGYYAKINLMQQLEKQVEAK